MVKKVKNIEIKDGVTMHYIEDTKFKTTTLGVYIHTPLKKETASKNALLPMVLRRGSEKWQSFDEIEKRLDDLCGAALNTGVIKRGEDHILCFDISTISDKYYIGDDNILLSCAELLFDIILNPKISDGAFCDEYVNSEKKNLCDAIDSLINDKQSYALWRLYEIMCEDEAFGVHELGEKHQVEKISAKELYEYYKNLIKNSKIDIFVCGIADIDELSGWILDALKNVETTDAPYPLTTKVSVVNGIKNVCEEFDTNQAKLSLGFRIKGKADYASMLVANSVWGSGAHSKLFNNVREKLSLAYYAFSRYDKYKDTILVGMGIETKNYKMAYDETLLQLKNVCDAKFSENELESAKAFIINALRSQRDSQYAMIDFYMGQLIRNVNEDIDDLCEKVRAVTPLQVSQTAQLFELDSVYFLKGKQ